MARKIAFLIVDGDKSTIVSLKKLIPKVVPNSIIYNADEGVYAIEFLKKQKIPMVIICEHDIQGVNGSQVLQKVKSEPMFKDSYFIMMIANSFPKDKLAKIIQLGVDAYQTKPFALEPLITTIKSAANNLQKLHIISEKDNEIANLNAHLKEAAEQMRNMIVKIQQHRFSDNGEQFELIAKAAVWILNMLDEESPDTMEKDIETAASMIHVGRLFLPDKNINDPVLVSGFAKNETMEQVPRFVRELIEEVKGFESVAKILIHIYENYDGSGIPDKLKGWEIPLGSRILRVVMDFEEQMKIGKKPMLKILEELDHESKRLYDFRCVTLMDQYLAASGRDRTSEERPIDAENLRPGNVISRSIITQSGVKLVSAGTILKEEKIEKIQSITEKDPVVGYIWIKTR